MADKNNTNDLPLDDRGIDNDMILEILESVITKLHDKMTSHNADTMSISDIKDVAITVDVVWHTVESILDLDDFLRNSEIDEDEDDSDNHRDK